MIHIWLPQSCFELPRRTIPFFKAASGGPIKRIKECSSSPALNNWRLVSGPVFCEREEQHNTESTVFSAWVGGRLCF